MRCVAAGFSYEKLRRELRSSLLSRSEWVLHALYCERCDARVDALWLLSAADWAEDEFLQEVWDGLLRKA